MQLQPCLVCVHGVTIVTQPEHNTVQCWCVAHRKQEANSTDGARLIMSVCSIAPLIAVALSETSVPTGLCNAYTSLQTCCPSSARAPASCDFPDPPYSQQQSAICVCVYVQKLDNS